MAQINRSEVLEKVQKGLRLDTAREKTPTEVADKVLPVFKVNPDVKIKSIAGTASDAAAGTVGTTHATKRTFVIGLSLTYSKDANATSINSFIALTPLGDANVAILRLNFEPTTAGNQTTILEFNPPMELDKASAITVNNSTAIASIDTSCNVYFYEVEE